MSEQQDERGETDLVERCQQGTGRRWLAWPTTSGWRCLTLSPPASTVTGCGLSGRFRRPATLNRFIRHKGFVASLVRHARPVFAIPIGNFGPFRFIREPILRMLK
jgi:hypothetical protein